MPAAPHPRLLLTRDDVAQLRSDPQASAVRPLVDRLLAVLKPVDADHDGLDVGFHAAGYALLHQLTGETAHAAMASALVDAAMTDQFTHQVDGRDVPLWGGDYKMILRTDPAVGVALAYDLASEAWSRDDRLRVAAALDDKAVELNRGGGMGWNASPASNWVANTASAAGLCALAILGDEGVTRADHSLDLSIRRLKSYLRVQSGSRGWTQESWQYYRYPMCHHVLPFLAIARRHFGFDFLTGTAADWLAALYAHVLVPGVDAAAIPNGDGAMQATHWRSGDLCMGLAGAPPSLQPAIRWTLEQRFIAANDSTHDIHLPHHALFALFNALHAPPAANPATVLDPLWHDRTNGLLLVRNRWQDAQDCVLGIDANASPMRGTGQPQCAGAIALVGRAHRLLVTRAMRGQPRASFNVIQRAGSVPAAPGRILQSRFDAGRGSVRIDLSRVYLPAPGGMAERSIAVDYTTPDCDAIITIADTIDPPRFPRKPPTFTLHGCGHITVDGPRFTVTQGQAVMRGLLHNEADDVVVAATVHEDGGWTLTAALPQRVRLLTVLAIGAADTCPQPEVPDRNAGETRR